MFTAWRVPCGTVIDPPGLIVATITVLAVTSADSVVEVEAELPLPPPHETSEKIIPAANVRTAAGPIMPCLAFEYLSGSSMPEHDQPEAMTAGRFA
jgi:hypothetical protein